jgi:hypothetical protein
VLVYAPLIAEFYPVNRNAVAHFKGITLQQHFFC